MLNIEACGEEFNDLTFNEIKFYYEVICRALVYATNGDADIMEQYLQRAQQEFELEMTDFENMSMQ